jgi:Family of unknown function (DUF6196)
LVHVSTETDEETERRLARVLAGARVTSYDGAFTFVESPVADPPAMREGCLALVRDDAVWSALVPALAGDVGERFGLLRFEFPPGVDNSGFVGWLATRLKRALGTGVFVVCGHDSAAGGIYDYWGFPSSLRDEVLREIASLKDSVDGGR